MKTQKIIVIGVLVLSSMPTVIYAENIGTSQDCLQDYTQDYKQDYKDDASYDNPYDGDMMYRALARDGYADGYSQEYTQGTYDYAYDYAEDIFDDLFLPLDGYTYTQSDEAPPSRITVFFASLGMELLFAYCKVKAWFAQQCCGKESQDISVDISIDTCTSDT